MNSNGNKNALIFLPFLVLGLASCGLSINPVSSTSGTTAISAPSNLSYDFGSRVVYGENSVISETPSISGTAIQFSVSPALPTGLSLNTVTGAITGTPSVTSAATNYTVTAMNSTGSTSNTFSLRVVDFAVDDNGDAVDAAPGAGGCATAGGVCTLRAAIMESNALAGTQAIAIPASMTITLTGVLDITTDMEIVGNSQSTSIIDGDATYEMLRVNASNVSFTLSYVRLQNGSGGHGAALLDAFNTNNTYDIRYVTFYNNVATQAGPAINIFQLSTAIIDQCIFDLNHTNGGFGGGAIHANSPLTITSSTFSGNYTSPAGSGGAIRLATTGTSITNTTFYNNTGASNTILYVNSPHTITLTNCTFAENTSPAAAIFADSATMTNNLLVNHNGPAGSCQIGAVTSNGGNLVYPAEVDCGFIHGNDPASADPLLGALQNNEGVVSTMALSGGSPAIDSGINAGCPATDARGKPRPVNSTCDIGAYEVQ